MVMDFGTLGPPSYYTKSLGGAKKSGNEDEQGVKPPPIKDKFSEIDPNKRLLDQAIEDAQWKIGITKIIDPPDKDVMIRE